MGHSPTGGKPDAARQKCAGQRRRRFRALIEMA